MHIRKPGLCKLRLSLIMGIVFAGWPAVVIGSEMESAGTLLHVSGSDLPLIWVLPFFGILMSIAVLPLIAPHFWHQNFGKISLFWAAAFIIPFIVNQGISITLYELLHVGFQEYIPFIILLLSLFTISGGIRLKGKMIGSPGVNVAILITGTFLASWMGTTGASMLLIRPLLRANSWRRYKVHVIVFFIFLVANIGGSLTPLGDPPLFLGFLKGVDFFWTTKAMLVPMLFMVGTLLVIFYGMDVYYYRREDRSVLEQSENDEQIGLEGGFNFLLLAGVIGAVLLSGFWHPQRMFTVYHVTLELQNVVRDLLLITLTIFSWRLTPGIIRSSNNFTWFPIQEVAKLFAGIFVTIIPAIAILKAGTEGALAPVVASVTSSGEPVNAMYFWSTGILSSFLDNAPTYLVFFNTAGGNAEILTGTYHNTLLAISTGAVFMGANTYIGNAPNFMVKSITEEAGVVMPSFFGYIVKYSLPILIPLFIIFSLIFFP